MSVLKEFKEFINKGNIVDLAVAVVIGGAFGKIVSALVADLVMPLVNGVLPHGDWRKWEATPLHFRVGDFLGAVVDFVIVAVVVFLVMVKIVGTLQRRRGPAVVVPATKVCPECQETVPEAARRCRACTSVLTTVAVVLMVLFAGKANAQTAAAPPAAAAPPPVVAVAPAPVKPPAPPAVEWKAQIKGGLLVTSGNSDTTNGSLGLLVSRKEGNNKLAIEGALAYGKSTVLTPVYDPNDPTMNTISGVDRTSVVSTNSWFGKGRYDRFFTPNNAGFAAAQAAADKIAGKSFFGGGQLGYSRQLVKTAMNLLVAELGYDFSYERYVTQPMKTLDPVSIHSARVFAGETLKLSPESGASASVEALFNLNDESKAALVNTGNYGVAAFHDTRVTGKVGLTTTLRKRLSVALGFTLHYDQNPALLPLPPNLPATVHYGNPPPFAKTTDTLTEATLVYTFL